MGCLRSPRFIESLHFEIENNPYAEWRRSGSAFVISDRNLFIQAATKRWTWSCFQRQLSLWGFKLLEANTWFCAWFHRGCDLRGIRRKADRRGLLPRGEDLYRWVLERSCIPNLPYHEAPGEGQTMSSAYEPPAAPHARERFAAPWITGMYESCGDEMHSVQSVFDPNRAPFEGGMAAGTTEHIESGASTFADAARAGVDITGWLSLDVADNSLDTIQ
ncbi:hypothetical protein JKP88DRAFT_272951 [Tribonema minus]|uniref:HSF-type DNA-binding domain-containing protein n=1 Tax=Tribonema minus TaxID=303371 RepID=A0A835YX19_9STRA|nr:hypothetical protein JKP88DRAFT_272951 [Tribonema minus]